MKRILILLLLTPILFAQEPTSQSTTPVYEIEIDYRCTSAIKWSVALMVSKQSGYTHEQARQKLEADYMFGALSGASPEGLAYLFDIVDLVYSHTESRDATQIVETSIEVNTLCVNYMDAPPPKVKPTTVKT